MVTKDDNSLFGDLEDEVNPAPTVDNEAVKAKADEEATAAKVTADEETLAAKVEAEANKRELALRDTFDDKDEKRRVALQDEQAALRQQVSTLSTTAPTVTPTAKDENPYDPNEDGVKWSIWNNDKTKRDTIKEIEAKHEKAIVHNFATMEARVVTAEKRSAKPMLAKIRSGAYFKQYKDEIGEEMIKYGAENKENPELLELCADAVVGRHVEDIKTETLERAKNAPEVSDDIAPPQVAASLVIPDHARATLQKWADRADMELDEYAQKVVDGGTALETIN